MSEKFELNEKFWSMNGILGRRGFIINTLIIQIICSVYIALTGYVLLLKPELMLNIITGQPGNLSYLVISLFSWLFVCVLLYPGIVRRVRDIAADDDNNKVTLISAVLAVIVFLGCIPIKTPVQVFSFNWISFAIILFLMVLPGKITSEKPASGLIKFNWGAFLGTWYWGIYNKVPKTLFIIPLFLTIYGWIPFMILCGLKGNEWARKNNTEKPVEDFHNAQKAQSLAFISIAPFLSVLIFLFVSFSAAVCMSKYFTARPEAKTKFEVLGIRYIEVSMKMYFTKVELAEADGENKFYMEPKVWVNLSENEKRKAFDTAVDYVVLKNGKALEEEKEDNADSEELTRAEAAENVKIISSFNNEVLASYEFDRETFNKLYKTPERKVSLKELIEYQKNVYKFNNYPTLP